MNIKNYTHKLGIALCCLGLLGGCATVKGGKSSKKSAKTTAQASRPTPKKDGIKSFSDVIKKDAKTDEGLFTVHLQKEDLYFQIPDSLIGREVLVVSRVAKTTTGLGYGGEKSNEQVIRFDRKNDKLLLRQVSYRNVAADSLPIYTSVQNSNFEPILATFDIEALGKDSASVVINVTDWFTKDVPAFGIRSYQRKQFKVRNVDPKRSYLESAKAYPQNVEVRHVLTYNAAEPPSNQEVGSFTVEMNQSMILLPVKPWVPRIIDNRVRYFGVYQNDFGSERQGVDRVGYAARYKLVPKDKEAYARGELVEPVEQIVYYIDPATPMKWRPYLKQGVEDWQKAFEAAGFKNAIIAKDPPTKEEDPEFSPEDVRYSVIRYFSSDIPNAYGPHVSDPRSGQILESDIGWYHNVMSLLRDWFFVQTAAVNENARSPQFKDEVMGQLIRFVSSHEVGHTLGLPHNMKASSAYTVEQLRDPKFSHEYGTAPSIMDYARFNYVAQPGDGHEMADLFPAIGPYDIWSIKWGYTWFPEEDAQVEKKILEKWTTEKNKDPMYYFGNPSSVDPTSQTESVGSDNMLASELGMKNLELITNNLLDWVETPGEDYSDLEDIYSNILIQWNRYTGHVVTNIGGVYQVYKTWDDAGVPNEMVPADIQRNAMKYLSNNVFITPKWLINQDILSRIEAAGAVERIRRYQVAAVQRVLDPTRLGRMIEQSALNGSKAYAPEDMLDDLRNSVFSELSSKRTIEVYRRNLQRGYLEAVEALMDSEPRSYGAGSTDISQSDIRPLLRDQLNRLKNSIKAKRTRFDRVSRAHLDDAIYRIDAILENDK